MEDHFQPAFDLRLSLVHNTLYRLGRERDSCEGPAAESLLGLLVQSLAWALDHDRLEFYRTDLPIRLGIPLRSDMGKRQRYSKPIPTSRLRKNPQRATISCGHRHSTYAASGVEPAFFRSLLMRVPLQ